MACEKTDRELDGIDMLRDRWSSFEFGKKKDGARDDSE